METTLKSHLNDDLDTFGIQDDNYTKFLDKRAEKIYNELNKRIR